MDTVQRMVAVLCLIPVDMRFDGCRGEDGPVGKSWSRKCKVDILPHTYSINARCSVLVSVLLSGPVGVLVTSAV